MDMRTGEILHARNHDTRLHPASLTKMMTLYIAFEAIRNGEITLDTPVRITANAARQPCSCLGLRAGQTIALRYLIRAAALRSGNDAATAIGEAISGSEAAFIERMNRTARAMGMNDTNFRNAHGLTASGHLSTARDMTTLGRQLYFDFPQYYNLFSRRSADAGIATVPNTNRAFLNSYSGADGIKTGFTRAAGFNLTASAQRGDRRIIVTMFGGSSVPDRTRRVTELMDMGFARAPATASVRRPPQLNYRGQPPGGVAVAAVAQRAPETAVRRSPLPPPRPVAAQEERLAALEDGIAAALAEAATTPPPAAPRDTPAAAAIAPVTPDRADALAAAVAESLPDPDPAEDLPFGLAGAPDQNAAAVAAVDPQARSSVPAPAELQSIAAAAVGTSNAVGMRNGSIPFAMHGASREAAHGEAGPDARAVGLGDQTPEPRPDTLLPQSELQTPDDATGPSTPDTRTASDEASSDGGRLGDAGPAVPPDAPDPSDYVVLTFATSDATDAPRLAQLAASGRAEPVEGALSAPNDAVEGSDIVLRQISTSSPRLWGVSLGRFGTRDAAERALMRAALAELSSFEAGLRRIQSGQSGFEATVVGLTEFEAQVACDRLQARDRDCAPIAP